MQTIITIRFEKTTVLWCFNRAVAYSTATDKILDLIHEYEYMEGAAKSFSVEYKEV